MGWPKATKNGLENIAQMKPLHGLIECPKTTHTFPKSTAFHCQHSGSSGSFVWGSACLSSEPGGWTEEWRRRKNWGKTKSKYDRKGRNPQVLLLIDPGAELGWAVLSETLPSWEAGDVCARAWGGMSVVFSWGWIESSTGLKLNRCGSSRPLGKRVLGWRSSSKKACAQASRGDSLVTGVYSKSREHKAMASGGVRGLNTFVHGCALICGNLNSV